MTFFIIKKFDKLKDPLFERKFDAYYLNMRTNNKLALIYNFLFMFRRLVFSTFAIMVTRAPILQIFTFVIMNILMIIYLCVVKPFDSKKINYNEIFNEICILIASYHLFMLTDFVATADLQYNIGWSLIAITSTSIVVNLVISLYDTFREIFKYAQWFYRKRKYNKRILSSKNCVKKV